MVDFYSTPRGTLYLRAKKLDLYRLLDLDSDSSVSLVEKAFRLKAAKCHPDKNPSPEAKELFQNLSDAKFVLKDSELRAKYDKLWKVHFRLRIHVCNDCGKRFASNAGLKIHSELHKEQENLAKFQNYERKEKKEKKNKVQFNLCYKCDKCSKSFTTQEAIEAHEKMIHIRERPFKCDICNKAFTFEDYLVNHIQMIHTFKCDQCEKTFLSSIGLDNHKLKKHMPIDDVKISFPCAQCDKRFSKASEVTKHVKEIHQKIKEFPCKKCEKSFVQFSELKQHFEKVHVQARDHVCKDCGKTFHSEKVLKVHVETVHQITSPFKCHHCDKIFSKSVNLDCHVRAAHPFKCNLCDKSFGSQINLRFHVRNVHEKAKVFPCEMCDKSFTEMNKLKLHASKVHQRAKKYKCEKCNQEFPNNSNLKCHVLAAHPRFDCDICGKTFTAKSSFLMHQKTHEKEEFECENCNKSFTDFWSLKLHLAHIHDLKHYTKCDHCEEKFPDKHLKKHHVKEVHEKKSFECKTCSKIFTKLYISSHGIEERKLQTFVKGKFENQVKFQVPEIYARKGQRLTTEICDLIMKKVHEKTPQKQIHILAFGDNDLRYSEDFEKFAFDMDCLCNKILRYKETHVIIVGILPSRKNYDHCKNIFRKADMKLKEIVAKNPRRISFVPIENKFHKNGKINEDLYCDSIHMSENGEKLWANCLYTHMRNMGKQFEITK